MAAMARGFAEFLISRLGGKGIKTSGLKVTEKTAEFSVTDSGRTYKVTVEFVE